MNSKYINLNIEDRFVKTNLLRKSYLIPNSTKPSFVDLGEMELGIVSCQIPEMARAVSSLLCSSLEDAKYSNEGHLPPHVVERIQLNIISPYGVAELWGKTGYRFVLSKKINGEMSEILAAALIGKTKDVLFFFTGRYNNLSQAKIQDIVDLNQAAQDNPEQKWFDLFDFPPLEFYKPKHYHQLANFVVNKAYRRQGLARFFINNIKKYYSKQYIDYHGFEIEHGQNLLEGQGLWQLADPPWLVKMAKLNFYNRAGAESFFIDQEWNPLPPTCIDGKEMTHTAYNELFGLPQRYENWQPNHSSEHLIHRIPEVCKIAQNPNAKLQYFQLMYDFLNK